MNNESTQNLDAAMVLGYFETVKSAFLLKVLLLLTATRATEDGNRFDSNVFSVDALEIAKSDFPDDIFYKALNKGNEELVLSLQEDILASSFNSSWIVFEKVIKDIINPNYTVDSEAQTMNYCNNRLGFSTQEKRNIELFYYIRNALAHHNGAYFSSKSIDHTYNGTRFKSDGNEGNKIIMSIDTVFKVISDTEKYTSDAFNRSGL